MDSEKAIAANYRDLFVAEWHESKLRPAFKVDVYFFSYDGMNYAYERSGDVWSFLFWVVGVIHETTVEQQGDSEGDDEFLDRAGVCYGCLSVAL